MRVDVSAHTRSSTAQRSVCVVRVSRRDVPVRQLGHKVNVGVGHLSGAKESAGLAMCVRPRRMCILTPASSVPPPSRRPSPL